MERKLLFVIFMSILLPILLIGGSFYLYAEHNIIRNKVASVEQVAHQKHEALVDRLKRLTDQARAVLVDLTKECKPNQHDFEITCINNKLTNFAAIEDALRVSLYLEKDAHTYVPIATIHRNDANLFEEDDDPKNIITLQPGQLAAFNNDHIDHVRTYSVFVQNAHQLEIVALFAVSTLQDIFSNDKGTLGASGETFLADRNGFFITKARYHAMQGCIMPIFARPMLSCLRSDNGYALDLDYRNVPIIHGFRSVPEIGGGCIMAHIDQKEAFTPLEYTKEYTFILAIMITGLSVVIAYVVGKKVSLPIRKLSLATREIAKGNYTFIADVDGTDEIADLAHSFNHMTAKLRDTLSELSIKNEELDALVEQITIDLVLSNRKLHDLFENMSSGVAVYQASPDGMDFVFVAINKASERLENISRKDVIGKSVVEAFPGVEQFGLLDVFRRVWKTGNPEQFPLAFYQDKRIEGWRDNFVYKLPSGEIVAIYDDVTEKKRLQQDLEERANTDFLTGLLNRRCFMERGLVEFTRSTRYERSLAVLMFDIDHFKKVNDTYGHQAGDIVIRTVAEVALTVVREVDLVGRLGGEEFSVILTEVGGMEALSVAERLRSTMESTYIPVNGVSIRVTISIGVALRCGGCTSLEGLLHCADRMLYTAKDMGRNRVCIGGGYLVPA